MDPWMQVQHDWFGPVNDGKEAVQKIMDGWPELLEYLRPMIESLQVVDEVTPHRALMRKRKLRYSDHGDDLNMQRVWNGRLREAWRRPVRTYSYKQSERQATIFINTVVNCNVSFTQALWRAAAVLKINDILQRAGRHVQIYSGDVAAWVSPFVEMFAIGVKVKDFTQPLTEEQLAAMSTSAFQRTLMFIANGALDHSVYRGLGRAADGLPIPLLERKKAGELIIQIGATTTYEGALRDIQNVQQQLIGEGEYLEGVRLAHDG